MQEIRYSHLIQYVVQFSKSLKLPDEAASWADEGRWKSFALQVGIAKEVADAEVQFAGWARQGIQWVGLGDHNYPELLSVMREPPLLLFYRAENPIEEVLHLPAVALVGSRKISVPMADWTEKLSFQLARPGNVIVSGLAYGVDSAAHQGALRASSPTIAVFGCGVDTIYPDAHRALAERILGQGGVLLSHYAPGTPPRPHHFLDRNRIIAGLSRGTVVVRAAQKSGALSTARHTLDEGRELMVVPGDVTDLSVAGSNGLLKTGAQYVFDAEDIFLHMPYLYQPDEEDGEGPGREPLSEELEKVYQLLLQHQRLHRDELVEVCGESKTIALKVLELEDAGYVLQEAGGWIVAVP